MRSAPFLAAALVALAPWAHAADAPARTGEQIVKDKCASCHGTGQHGSPRIGDKEAWNPRLKKGLDATVLAAIRGHGSMPSRGGMAELTDAEFRSAIVYMVNPAFPPPPPPPAPALGPNQRIVDGTEVYLGVKRVSEGVYYVNITLRDEKTHAAIGDAKVEASVSNPVMGGQTRKLDRVAAAGAVSYGNEFRMSGKEPHVITVQVRRAGNPRLIETRFDFRE